MTDKMKKNFPSPEILSSLRLLLMDVDGVLTDGSIIYTSAGEEVKAFNVKDGAGVKYWLRAGHSAGIITGRTSVMVERRALELGVRHLEMGAKSKVPAFEKVIAAAGVAPSEVIMIGDDLMDFPLLQRVGFGVAVADAVGDLRETAHYVTQAKGGRGAVREVVELVLKAQGRWDGIMERYLV